MHEQNWKRVQWKDKRKGLLLFSISPDEKLGFLWPKLRRYFKQTSQMQRQPIILGLWREEHGGWKREKSKSHNSSGSRQVREMSGLQWVNTLSLHSQDDGQNGQTKLFSNPIHFQNQLKLFARVGNLALLPELESRGAPGTRDVNNLGSFF